MVRQFTLGATFWVGLSSIAFWGIPFAGSSLVSSPTEAQSPPIEIIIDRQVDSIELFVAVDTALVEQAYSQVPPGLLDGDGMVKQEVLRKDSAWVGNWLGRHWEVSVAGERVAVEAMQLMVHLADVPLPFDHPMAAYSAVSVCTTPEDAPKIASEESRIYASFFLHPVDAKGDVHIDLAPGSQGFGPGLVSEFDRWETVGNARQAFHDGEINLPRRK